MRYPNRAPCAPVAADAGPLRCRMRQAPCPARALTNMIASACASTLRMSASAPCQRWSLRDAFSSRRSSSAKLAATSAWLASTQRGAAPPRHLQGCLGHGKRWLLRGPSARAAAAPQSWPPPAPGWRPRSAAPRRPGTCRVVQGFTWLLRGPPAPAAAAPQSWPPPAPGWRPRSAARRRPGTCKGLLPGYRALPLLVPPARTAAAPRSWPPPAPGWRPRSAPRRRPGTCRVVEGLVRAGCCEALQLAPQQLREFGRHQRLAGVHAARRGAAQAPAGFAPML